MQNPTTIVLSRMVAQTRAMDVIANNIANAGTPGFRGERMVFSDFLVRERPGIPGGETSLTYLADRATYRDGQAGSLTQTGNPLDLAITGAGYFTVQSQGGPRLTRAGHFALSASGAITDENGDALLDTAGKPLQVSPADTALTIAADGTLSSQNGRIGRVGVVKAADENKLKAEGSRLLNATSTTTAPDPSPRLVQGAVENSNVVPTAELTTMMDQSREFEFASQFIQSESEREQGVISKLFQTPS